MLRNKKNFSLRLLSVSLLLSLAYLMTFADKSCAATPDATRSQLGETAGKASDTSHSQALFQKALSAYPLLNDDIPIKDYAKVLQLYGPAAKAGNVVAMGICAAILLKEKKWGQLYAYLAPLDTMDAAATAMTESDAAIVRKQLRLSSPELLLGSMYKLLSQLHLVGLGTAQDYTKARQAFLHAKRIRQFAVRHAPKDQDFMKPQNPASQKAFWEYTRTVPGAEKFLLRRLALGEKGYDIEKDLKRFVRYKNAKQELEFYEQYMSDSLLKVFGHRIAVLMLQLKEFSPENLQKIRAVLEAVAKEDTKARDLLECLPKDLQDKDNIAKLIAFYAQHGMASKMPRWFFAYFTNQIDAGILDKPLSQEFSYILQPQEQKLIAEYDAVTDKAAFVKALPKTFLREKLFAYKFHIYQDLAENHPELLAAYKQHMGTFALGYAPLRFYEGQRAQQKSLGPVTPAERSQLQLQMQKDFKIASDAGYAPAMERYGHTLILSEDPADKFKGFELVMQAARMQNPKALQTLMLLPNNGGDAKAREKNLLTKAAALGSAEAVRRLKAHYNTDISMDTTLYLADLVKNARESIVANEAKKLLMDSSRKDDVLLGFAVLQYLAKKKQDSLFFLAPLMGSLFYSGTLVPQNFDTAFAYYSEAFDTAPPKYKGQCTTLLPLAEMYALGLGTQQDKNKVQQLLHLNPQCKGGWAQKTLPTLQKSATAEAATAAGFAPRFIPNFTGWKSLSIDFTAEEMEKIRQYSQSKQTLLAFLEQKPSAYIAATDAKKASPQRASDISATIPVAGEAKASQGDQDPKTAQEAMALPAQQKKSPVAPQHKKPGLAVLQDNSYSAQDRMGLGTFIPDQRPDSCLDAVAHAPSPLIAVRLESLSGMMVSWKTADVKTSALGTLAVYHNDALLNAGHASFALPVGNPTALTLCVQDTQGALADAKTRMRVIFYHEDGSRSYAWVHASK